MNGARASARYCAWAISIEIYTWNRMEKIYHVKAFSNVARHYIVLAKMSVITQNITYPHCDGNLKLALPQLETNEVSFRKLWASANPFIIKKKIKAYALTFIGYWFILLCLVLDCLPRLKKNKSSQSIIIFKYQQTKMAHWIYKATVIIGGRYLNSNTFWIFFAEMIGWQFE